MDMTLPKMLDVRVRPFGGPPRAGLTKLLAFAELVIADAFVIKGIPRAEARRRGERRAFRRLPRGRRARAQPQDRWFDVARTSVTAEARAASIALVLERYRQARETPPMARA